MIGIAVGLYLVAAYGEHAMLSEYWEEEERPEWAPLLILLGATFWPVTSIFRGAQFLWLALAVLFSK